MIFHIFLRLTGSSYKILVLLTYSLFSQQKEKTPPQEQFVVSFDVKDKSDLQPVMKIDEHSIESMKPFTTEPKLEESERTTRKQKSEIIKDSFQSQVICSFITDAQLMERRLRS